MFLTREYCIIQTQSIDSQTLVLQKLQRKQQFYLKEYGLETSLYVGLFIKWKLPTKQKYYRSPLLYKACHIKKQQKINVEFSVEINDDVWFVNPIILFVFSKVFQIELDSSYHDKAALIAFLKRSFEDETVKFDEVDGFSDQDSWQLINFEAVGTFNYKKSLIRKRF